MANPKDRGITKKRRKPLIPLRDNPIFKELVEDLKKLPADRQEALIDSLEVEADKEGSHEKDGK